MAPFMYRCPQTGFSVQALAEDDLDADHLYDAVICTACQRMHLVAR
jgi:hypothetical protein